MEIILVAVIFYGGGYLLIKWLNNSYDKHGSLMYPKEKEEGKSYSMQSDTSKDQNYPSNTTIFDTTPSDHLKNSDYTGLGSHTNNDTYLTNKINEAIVHKRAGEYGKAVAVYSDLSNQFPKHPGILKSWAKILVCQNKYEDAILKFRKAASLYAELGNESEGWQCNDQISTVKNRFNNQGDFIQYYRAVSGQRNAIPQLIDKKADSDKSILIQSKTMGTNRLDKDSTADMNLQNIKNQITLWVQEEFNTKVYESGVIRINDPGVEIVARSYLDFIHPSFQALVYLLLPTKDHYLISSDGSSTHYHLIDIESILENKFGMERAFKARYFIPSELAQSQNLVDNYDDYGKINYRTYLIFI
jgi:tetratricopeptide (TPR) repeat protein